jgi:hypothetical protein
MKRAVFVIAACVLIVSTAQAGEGCFKYEPQQVVTLEGKVITRTFFGQPGYGETPEIDTREKQAILLSSSKICTVAGGYNDQPAETNQSEITLVPMAIKSLIPYIGKQVTVKGGLFHAVTGHHHTPLLISVQAIESLGQ